MSCQKGIIYLILVYAMNMWEPPGSAEMLNT